MDEFLPSSLSLFRSTFVRSPTRKHAACVQARSRSGQADSDARCKTNEETGDSAARLTISATNIPRSVLPQRCNPVPNGLEQRMARGILQGFRYCWEKNFFSISSFYFIFFFFNRIDYAEINSFLWKRKSSRPIISRNF